MMKKLCVLMALVLLLCQLPMAAMAETETETWVVVMNGNKPAKGVIDPPDWPVDGDYVYSSADDKLELLESGLTVRAAKASDSPEDTLLIQEIVCYVSGPNDPTFEVTLSGVKLTSYSPLRINGTDDSEDPEDWGNAKLYIEGETTLNTTDYMAIECWYANLTIDTAENASLQLQGDAGLPALKAGKLVIDGDNITVTGGSVSGGNYGFAGDAVNADRVVINGSNITLTGGSVAVVNVNTYMLAGMGISPNESSFQNSSLTINGDNVRISGGSASRSSVVDSDRSVPAILYDTVTINGYGLLANGGAEDVPAINADKIILKKEAQESDDGASWVAAQIVSTPDEGSFTKRYFRTGENPVSIPGDPSVSAAGAPNVPTTGDGANLALWTLLLAASAAAFVLLSRKAVKEQ